jgi:hypothetical protein
MKNIVKTPLKIQKHLELSNFFTQNFPLTKFIPISPQSNPYLDHPEPADEA